MSTATLTEARIVSVSVTDKAIAAHLADGRIVSVPLEWSWRLADATPEQRAHWEIIGDGQGVYWPEVDEDFSVEGMLRGVPAKRPSRTEMRILLDASSLIDAEHGKPVSFAELDKMLREHHARLILTCTNVLEFAAPFERTGDRLALRGQLQQVERLPVGYLHEAGIKPAELREAVNAFTENREFVPVSPYVKRWDETLDANGPSLVALLVNQSLYDLVSMALSHGSVPRRAKERWEPSLKKGYGQARAQLSKMRGAGLAQFEAAVQGSLAYHSIALPPDKVRELAKWVYGDSPRCPGFRLAYEWHQELVKNATEQYSWNDIFDRAHVPAVPYVDVITMDRNAAAHCRGVTRRLKKINPAINYGERIFTSLEALLAAKF